MPFLIGGNSKNHPNLIVALHERILVANSLADINSLIRPDGIWTENLTPLFNDFRLNFNSVKESILQSEFLNKETFGYFEEQQALLYKQYG
jgi:hypothetical protein